jgi:UDP-2,3-diacylglucosamine pyrophosphatase LpxH
MNVSLPLYEDLYAVSDLHLGGTRGIRIFRSGENLAQLVRHLAHTNPTHGGQRALVLNGDVIDSLAEGVEHYVASPQAAAAMLEDIMNHPDFEMVWSALREFVGQENHQLVICIGNHDLELAYPNVQEQIVVRLGGATDEPTRGRIRFATLGVGHLCRVGSAQKSARVLCLHGNEYDKWNAVSPEDMERLVRSACLGRPAHIADDPPNAGTQLVIDVMNGIKRDYPFVDLLKPEVETVFNVLLALNWRTARALPDVLKLTAKAETQGASRISRVLGEPAGEATPPATTVPSWKPGGQFGAFLGMAPSSQDLLDDAWKLSASEVPTPEEQPDEVLGLKEVATNTLRYLRNLTTEGRQEALRHALLDWIAGDRTWHLDGPDAVCDQLAKLAPDVEVVIAGHTHLGRQKHVCCQPPDAPCKASGYLYLNTGTWARVMELDEGLLGTPAAFSTLWDSLQKKSIEALDADASGIVKNMGTVGIVRLTGTGDAIEAALCEKKAGADEPQLVAGAAWQEVDSNG